MVTKEEKGKYLESNGWMKSFDDWTHPDLVCNDLEWHYGIVSLPLEMAYSHELNGRFPLTREIFKTEFNYHI